MIKDSREKFNMRGHEQQSTSQPPSSENNKGVLSFATVGRTATGASTIEAPPQAKNGPEKQNIQPSRKGLYARLAGALLVLAATGGPAVDNHIKNEPEVTLPAVGRDVVSIPGFYWNFGKSAVDDIERLFGIKQKEIVLPYNSTKAEIQTITAGINAKSITNITQEEIASLFSNAVSLRTTAKESVIPPDVGTNNVKILLPAKLEDGKTVKLSSRIIDANLTLNKDNIVTQHKVKMFSGEDFFYDKDVEIPLFVYTAEIFQLPPVVVAGKSYFGGLAIRQTLPDGSILVFRVLATSDIRDIEPVGDIKNAPIVATSSNPTTPDTLSYFKAKNGIPLSITTENGKISFPTILKTTKDGAHVTIDAVSDRYANVSLSMITEINQENNLTSVLYAPKLP